jgi:hypothetical protein
VFCVALGLLALVTTNAHATLLGPGGNGLTSTHIADIQTAYISINYTLDSNGTTGTLTASGYPDQFAVNINSAHAMDPDLSSFTLTMTVNRNTGVPVSGTVSYTGVTTSPAYSGDLLDGTITQFGFVNEPNTVAAEGLMNVIFTVTGGALAAPYYTAHTGGIILNLVQTSADAHPFAGVFTAPFQNDQINTPGSSDTFAIVPEPSSFLLFSLGFTMLAWRLRRKRPGHPA